MVPLHWVPEWLVCWAVQNGAHLYVCGDAKRMAPDVRSALQKIVQQEAKTSEISALAYVEKLREGSECVVKRYHEDVWAGNA